MTAKRNGTDRTVDVARRARSILSAIGALVLAQVLFGQDMRFVGDVRAAEDSSAQYGPSSDSPVDGFIHVGKAVHAVETIKVVATLIFYASDYAFADYVDRAYSYDVSIFEIVKPAQHRGKQFQVMLDPSVKRTAAWCQIGRTYSMVIDRDIIESEGMFPGPELITIENEIK